jgi:hypothetical protein
MINTITIIYYSSLLLTNLRVKIIFSHPTTHTSVLSLRHQPASRSLALHHTTAGTCIAASAIPAKP